MIPYKFGDILLVSFIQPNGVVKKRPALAILDLGDDDIVMAPITTTERLGKGDYKMMNWENSGLLLESWVRLAKIACQSKDYIERTFGKLTIHDCMKIIALWRQTYKF